MNKIKLELYGITKDTSPYQTIETFWSDGNNVSFKNSSTKKSLGYAQVLADEDADAVAPIWISPWTTLSNAYWVNAGVNRIQRTVGNGIYSHITKLRTATQPTDPLSSTASSTTVTVVDTAHGASTGDIVILSDYTMDSSGLITAEVNDQHEITVTDANTYTFEVTTAATSTVSNFGGSSGNINYESPYQDSEFWNGGIMSSILILNNGKDNPQAMAPSSTVLADIANWPADTTCKVIRPFKEFLVALYTQESGVDYPFRVFWSHPAEPGSVPASWDVSDSTKDAGNVELAQTSGVLVDCLPLRDTNIIYKEDSVYTMNYIGGENIFRFQQLFDDVGLLSQRCVKGFSGKHFVVGQNDVYVHDGIQKQSIINSRMRDWLFNSIDPTNYLKTFVTANYAEQVMMICFPEIGQSYCTKALIWNWAEDTWTIRDLPNISHAGWGVIDDSEEIVAWTGDDDSWDSDPTSWGERTFNPTQSKVVFAGTLDSKIYQGDVTTTHDGVNYNAYVERSGLTLGTDQVKHVSRIFPQFSGTGEVIVKIGVEDHPGQGVSYQSHVFTIGQDYKIDTRVSGRFLALRVESADKEYWSLDGIELDIQIDGGR